MVIAEFSVQNKSDKICFFEETFLLVDTSIEVYLWLSFLALSNVVIPFNTKSFTWKFYSAAEVLLTDKRVKLINKKKFTRADLDKNTKAFVIHIAAPKVLKPAVYLF